MLTSGFVAFITACHHSCIFDSREEAYSCSAGGVRDGAPDATAPPVTGMPFIDDHRCTDWLPTAPSLLIETLLVTPLDEAIFNAKAKSLGAGSALLAISGYHAELTVTDDLMPRRAYRFILMTYLMSEMQLQTMYDMLSFVLASTIAKPRARGFACLRSMTCTRMQC